ncbi:hypothetical protein G6F42_016849 [Rhizopus arrhizus]|nr:hypothetical protein G6F42_016849 [Rhizopus arrhizus]
MQLLPNGQVVASLYFGYSPSLPLTYVGMIVFGLLFLGFCARVFLSHSRLFLLLLPFTSLLQVVGYALRYECANNPTMGLFIAMSIFLLLCANVIALVNYKTIREVIVYSGVETRFVVIGPRFAKVFFDFNIIASILQGVGGGIQSDPDSRVIGSHLTIAGSCIQLATLICFLVAARYVHQSEDYHFHVHGKDPKRKLFAVIYITTLLLCVRLVYRIASYAVGIKGVIATHEWTYYVFDALMLVLCLSFHFVFFIGNYLPHVNEVTDEENYDKENSTGSEQIDLRNMSNNDNAPQYQQNQQSPYHTADNDQRASDANAEPGTAEKLISVLPVTRIIYRIAKKA